MGGRMAKRHADIIILCEDRAQANFILHHLKKRDFNYRQLRVLPRDGSGSGQQFVLQKYAAEVKAYRSKANHLSCALITAIDADRREVQNVQQRLEEQLQNADMENRKTGERIALLIPKRNIETWMVFFRGLPVMKNQTTNSMHWRKTRSKQALLWPNSLDNSQGQTVHRRCKWP